jgi:hypothetical protein
MLLYPALTLLHEFATATCSGMITSAGIRAGVTLRPQIITPTPGWSAAVPPNKPPWPYYQKKLLLPNSKQPDEDAIFANLQVGTTTSSPSLVRYLLAHSTHMW